MEIIPFPWWRLSPSFVEMIRVIRGNYLPPPKKWFLSTLSMHRSKTICVIRAMSIKLFGFHFGDKVNNKMAENQKNDDFFTPEQGPSPQIYVPLSISSAQKESLMCLWLRSFVVSNNVFISFCFRVQSYGKKSTLTNPRILIIFAVSLGRRGRNETFSPVFLNF